MNEAPGAHREVYDTPRSQPDDFVSKLIHPVHLCALGGLSGEIEPNVATRTCDPQY